MPALWTRDLADQTASDEPEPSVYAVEDCNRGRVVGLYTATSEVAAVAEHMRIARADGDDLQAEDLLERIEAAEHAETLRSYMRGLIDAVGYVAPLDSWEALAGHVERTYPELCAVLRAAKRRLGELQGVGS
jgi:hypothetical protein